MSFNEASENSGALIFFALHMFFLGMCYIASGAKLRLPQCKNNHSNHNNAHNKNKNLQKLLQKDYKNLIRTIIRVIESCAYEKVFYLAF